MPATESICRTCGTTVDPARHRGCCAACLFAEAFLEPSGDGILTKIGAYEVIEEIARGGMGVVYRARQREPEREVALKTMLGAGLESPEALARFHTEAEAMAGLDHPAILPVYAFGEQDGVPYFTMKLAGGGTLARRIGDYAGRWRTIAKLMTDLAEAVQFAHSRGVLHRDLKPGNILFDTTEHPFVSDFGLAKILGDVTRVTHLQTMMGTPAYMAPELTVPGGRGATTASDVWALGVMLYELLAGQPPFRGENVPALLRQVVDEEPSPLPKSVPRTLGIIVLRALQKDPDDRFSSAQEFADDLRRWLRNEPVRARPVSTLERLTLWARRKPALAALGMVLVVTVLAGAVLTLRSNHALRALDGQRRAQVHRALVEQADAERQSRTLGRRERALGLVREALEHGTTVRARSVVAAALAEPDLRVISTFAIGRMKRGQSPMAFTPDLDHSLALVPTSEVRDKKWKEGALGLWRASEGRFVQQFPLTSRTGFAEPGLSPDARWMCLTMSDTKLEIWDCQTGKRVTTIESTAATGAAFHPTDRSLIACVSGELVRLRPPSWRPEPIIGGMTASSRLAVSPDGAKVAIFQWDRATGTRLEIRELGDGRLIKVAETNPYGVPAWSSDSRRIAVFNYATGALNQHEVMDSTTSPMALVRTPSTGRRVALHPDARTVAWVANDGFLELRDQWAGEAGLRLPAAGMNIAFSSDGRLMAYNPTSDLTAIAELLDSPILEQRKGLYAERTVDDHLAVSPDGRWVATYDLQGLSLWRADGLLNVAHQVVVKRGQPFNALHFSPDSRSVRFHTPTTLRTVWNLVESSDGSVRFGTPDPAEARSLHTLVVASADGRWEHTVRRDEKNLVAYLWKDGRIARQVRRQVHPTLLDFDFGAMAPDGSWYASSGMGVEHGGLAGFTTITHFDTDHHRMVLSEKAANTYPAVSSDGRWLLGGEATDYVIWDTKTWQPIHRIAEKLSDHAHGSAAFSADGKLLAIEIEHGRIRLLRVGTWDEVLTLTPPQSLAIGRMTFSPDSRHLYMTGGQILSRWNVAALRAELEKLGLGW